MDKTKGRAEVIKEKSEILSLVTIREPYENAKEKIINILSRSGALLEGHFELESGKHSNRFCRFASIAGNQQDIDFIVNTLLADLKRRKILFDVALAQESAGFILAERIAKLTKKQTVIVRTDEKNRPTKELVNESDLIPGDRVLVVVDLATTGSSMRKMIELAYEKKGIPVAGIVFASRDKKAILALENEHGIPILDIIGIALEEYTYETEYKDNRRMCSVCQDKDVLPLYSWEI